MQSRRPKSTALTLHRDDATGKTKGPKGQFEATAARLLSRLGSLDFQAFEHMAPDVAVPYLAAGPYRELDHVLLEVMRLSASATLLWGAMPASVALVLHTTESMAEGHDDVTFGVVAAACDEGDVPHFDNAFVGPLGAWAQQAAVVDADDAAAQAARGEAVAEAMAHLMRQRARLRLQAALVSKWGMISAGEDARRDARFWTRALLVATGLNRPDARAWQAAGMDLLGEAVAVRQLLMRFRADALATADLALSLASGDVGLQLRELDLRILALGNARGYQAVRARDRLALARFHGRIVAWLTGDWEDEQAARQIFTDATAFAEGLEAVNRRAVLVAHDLQVQAQALELLARHGRQASTQAASPMHELQALLERLRWCSPELQMFLGDHDELALPHDARGEALAHRLHEAPLTLQHVADLTAIVQAAVRV